jgi:hypothetical protein
MLVFKEADICDSIDYEQTGEQLFRSAETRSAKAK